jgi:hypothetical protein
MGIFQGITEVSGQQEFSNYFLDKNPGHTNAILFPKI